jgi:hypothetical protein
MLIRDATYTNFIVFGLTWLGLELTNYHTWGEHANHYATDAVTIIVDCKVNHKIKYNNMSGQKFLSFLNCLKSNKGHIKKKDNIEALEFNFGTC